MAGFWWWETTADALFHWGSIIMDYGLYSIWVKNILMLDLFQLLMLTDGLEWCGLLWCFYQTLILTAPIHCRASIAETLMQRHISTNLMKKQTHPDLRWTADIHFWVNYSFNTANTAKCMQPVFLQWGLTAFDPVVSQLKVYFKHLLIWSGFGHVMSVCVCLRALLITCVACKYVCRAFSSCAVLTRSLLCHTLEAEQESPLNSRAQINQDQISLQGLVCHASDEQMCFCSVF